MKTAINFDEKTIAALLYVVSKLGKEKSEMHSVFKALYFADKKHLANYGRMIINDKYFAMDNGPVPSLIYDGCKKSRTSGENFGNFLKMDGHMHIRALRDPDMDELSKSDIECLDAGIFEVKEMNYNERIINSHDDAYNGAWNHKHNSQISIIEIARAGGAHDEMIQFLSGNFA